MESESDKLLKSLRHQSDAKYMYFFIQPLYPPDYSAFISTPSEFALLLLDAFSGRDHVCINFCIELTSIFSSLTLPPFSPQWHGMSATINYKTVSMSTSESLWMIFV